MSLGKTIPQLTADFQRKYNCDITQYHVRRFCDLAEARGAEVQKLHRYRLIPPATAAQIESDLLNAGVLRVNKTDSAA